MGKGLQVQLFGHFRIQSEEGLVTKESIRSDQLEKLLVYLLIYRRKNISLPELVEVLWEDGVSHPQKALKNLVYRLRNALKSLGDDNFILTNQGNYSWNPDIPVLLDTELFEVKGKTAMSCQGSQEEQCLLYEEALVYYQGECLPEFAMESWQVPLDTYYHSLYLTMVKNLAKLYDSAKNYEEMALILGKALSRDNIDDELHYWNIRSLMGQNKMDLAWSHYKKARELLYRNLGVRKTEKMTQIYRELLSQNQTLELDVNKISEEMEERESPHSVYFCEYEIFREVYRLEARRILRLGIAEYVLLLTLQIGEQTGKPQEYITYCRKKSAAHLKKVLEKSLRVGDVVSACNESQYIAMLPTCTLETGTMVAKRIQSRFQAVCPDKNVRLLYELKALEPKIQDCEKLKWKQ
jgi:DNA-binding SARP family transcriptional activator